MSRTARLVLTLAALLGSSASRAVAQEPAAPPPIIDSLVVEGAVRNTPRQVLDYSLLRRGEPANYRSIQRAITALFASGQFEDVRIEQLNAAGVFTLRVIVRERPLLQHWTLRGAERVEEGAIRRKVSLQAGRPLDRAAMERSRAAIDSVYRKRGYYAAEVKVLEIPVEGNQVRVVFDVNKGNRVSVGQVVIEGNEKFKDKDVVSGLSTRPEGFWWFKKGEYSEERVEEDIRTNLPNWYANRGHVDLRVLSDSLIADSVPGKAIVKFQVEEGPAYKVGRFDVTGNRRFSSEQISGYLPFGELARAGDGKSIGVPFSRAEWASATERVQNLYQNNGYIYSRVDAEEVRRTDPDGTNYLDLRWRIYEGQPATINRIIIVGNDVTHERVIREAIVMLPGQIFNRDALLRSYQNVSNLNFFQQPLEGPDVQPAENGVDVDITFRVVERNTGNINFGASVGQGVGVGGFLGLEEPNLFGKAKRGKLQWQFGQNINDFSLTFTDPAIRESRISGTVSLFNSQRTYTIADLGKQRSRGFNLQFGLPLFGSRYTRVYASYGLQQIRYSNTAADVQRFFACDNCTRSSLGLSVARDTRIGLPFAIGGSSLTIGGEQSGGFLGGTGDYQKIDLEKR